VAHVLLLYDIPWLERHREAGPTAAAVEFLGGCEERLTRHDVDVDTRLLLVPKLVVEGRLGGTLLVTAYWSGVSRPISSGSFV